MRGGEAVELLETFIIDEEGRRRRRDERPAVELPLPSPEPERPPRKTEPGAGKPQRGVVVIDLRA
jgi:hypothetical protein